MDRKLRFGMIGGGRGAFIGAVHRIAAQMDGLAELVAGAFSSSPERSKQSGADLLLDPERVYGSYAEMAEGEAMRPAHERLDFVVIVTPNHQHFEPAKIFLERGFHVVCDKPMTLNLEQAVQLRDVVRKSGLLFALTHNYTGSVMVKQARELVMSGKVGAVRKVLVEYPQGWLSSAIEESGNKQASWRTDPARSGAAGSVADLGTHAEHLASYVTGLRVEAVCADLTAYVEGRQIDDDGNVLVRYEGGAKGILHCSQICAGDENALSIRVYGDKASIEWQQEHPNELILKYPNRPREIWRRGNDYIFDRGKELTRLPFGHPEGYLEAFANLYRNFFIAVKTQLDCCSSPAERDFPSVEDGLTGMAFIEAVVESSRLGSKWVNVKQYE